MKPGIYHGMTFAEYLAIPALSNSLAKVGMTRSWYHAHRYSEGELREESDSFDLGSAAHATLLEDGNERIVWVDAADWRTKAAKEARDAARTAGKIAMLPKHFDKIMAMKATALDFLTTALQRQAWDAGASEVTMIWNDGGTLCKARADRLYRNETAAIMWDYKTCGNAHPESFGRDMARYWYDFQAAWYSRGATMVPEGVKSVEFLFLAQESEYPYRCSLHALSTPLMEIALHKTDVALREYRECRESGVWPDYGTNIHYQEPSSWQMADHEALLNQGEE